MSTFTTTATSHRWTLLIATVTTMLILGTTYSLPIWILGFKSAPFSFNQPEINFISSSLFVGANCVGSLLAPVWVSGLGASRATLTTPVLFIAGYAGLYLSSSFPGHMKHPWEVVAVYVLLVGVSIGLVFSSSVTNLLPLFPGHETAVISTLSSSYAVGGLAASLVLAYGMDPLTATPGYLRAVAILLCVVGPLLALLQVWCLNRAVAATNQHNKAGPMWGSLKGEPLLAHDTALRRSRNSSSLIPIDMWSPTLTAQSPGTDVESLAEELGEAAMGNDFGDSGGGGDGSGGGGSKPRRQRSVSSSVASLDDQAWATTATTWLTPEYCVITGLVVLNMTVGTVYLTNLGNLTDSLYDGDGTEESRRRHAASQVVYVTAAQVVGRLMFIALSATSLERCLKWCGPGRDSTSLLATLLHAGTMIGRPGDPTVVAAVFTSLAYVLTLGMATVSLTPGNLLPITLSCGVTFGCMWTMTGTVIGYVPLKPNSQFSDVYARVTPLAGVISLCVNTAVGLMEAGKVMGVLLGLACVMFGLSLTLGVVLHRRRLGGLVV